MPSAESSDTDGQVRAHLERGDLAAAATCVLNGHGHDVLAYLAAVLRDASAADEAFSIFCEKLWRGIGSFRGEAPVRAWALRLAWSAAGDYHRDPYRRRATPLEALPISGLVAQLRSTTAAHLRSAVKDRMARLADSLDAEDRSLLHLRIERRLPWNAVAEIMAREGEAVAPAVLRKRFERLKERLRKLAKAEGLLP
jgi:RNA polymerase sigma-70 factor (ECF subfamily)